MFFWGWVCFLLLFGRFDWVRNDDFDRLITYFVDLFRFLPSVFLFFCSLIGKNEVSWIDDNKEYYVTSEVLSSNELVKIAESMSVAQIEK